MSRPHPAREQLVEAVMQEGRRHSTHTVLFHAAIADRLGLNPSDHKCADLICNQTGPVSAGRLAELTGLSTGAITGVVDRLERAGFVFRTHDAEDRRRVVITGSRERTPDMRRLFRPLAESYSELCQSYTNEQLSLILDFMSRSNQVMAGQIQRLRETAEPASRAQEPPRRAPEKPKKPARSARASGTSARKR